jgi:6-pyruvoyltetrahydropterin/6-carboxytetrahydropterin synthase
MSAYRVHICKDNLIFASGHFVSYDGDKVEPLHGHNYRLSVTVEGPVDENHYVFNFVTLKRLMKRVADELDHRMLLPRDNALIEVQPQDDGGVIVRTQGRWYRFPQEDVVILPLPNTTVEMLARHVCGRLRAELATRPDAAHLSAIEVAVEETFGQTGIYREEFSSSL